MKRLRELRIKNNLSQQTLAELIGFDYKSTISSYELGRRKPDPATLKKLAEVLNTTVDELLKD